MRLLRRELAGWEERSIHSITRRDVLKVLDAAVDRGAETMANRCLAHIRKLFNWAVERGILASTANPVAGLKPPTKEKHRDRILTVDELAAVWRAAGRLGYPFGPAIRLLIATGQRREEVGQLVWSELDLDAALWTMPPARNKGGRQHVVPLNTLALESLALCPRVGAHVFTTTGRTAVSGWSKCKVILDRIVAEQRGDALAPWVIHDLRRTVASSLVALGVRPDVIEAALGHAHPAGSQLSSTYQRHTYGPEIREALYLWARHVDGLLERDSGNPISMRQQA
jgi:integrase